MSGFLVVAYTQEGRHHQRRPQRRSRRDLELVALMLTALTRLLRLTGATHYLGALVLALAKPKKVFDAATNTYVDPDSLLTPYQRRLKQFHQAQAQANRDPRWRQILNNINDAVDDDGARLFHRASIDHWRHTYHHLVAMAAADIGKGTAATAAAAATGDANGGAASAGNGAGSSAITVRQLVALPRFWGTVYQDIKVELTHAACDYFDVLPPVGATIAYFTTVLDRLLDHIDVISAHVDGVTAADEVAQLRAATYWYLPDNHGAPLYQQYRQFRAQFSPRALAVALTQATLMLIDTMVENIATVMATEAIDNSGDTCRRWRRLCQFIAHQMFALVSEDLVGTRPAPATPEARRPRAALAALAATTLSQPLAAPLLAPQAPSAPAPAPAPSPERLAATPRKKLGLFAKFKRG